VNRLSIVAFRELVESPTLIAGLVGEFGLSAPPHNLTPEKLRNQIAVDVIRESTIIEVAVRLKDPSLLVKVADRYAEMVVETAQRLNTEGIDYTAERIRQQRDTALDRLTKSEQALEAYQRSAQIELLRTDVDTLLARRPDALDLIIAIQGARARLQQAEAELDKQIRIRDVRSGVDSVPATPQSGRSTAAKPDDLRIRTELLDPYVNPVYDALARDVSQYRAELAGLDRERKELVDRLQLDAPTADKLARLYRTEAELETLTRDRDIARQAYLNAAHKYEDARLQSTIRSPRLQILDRPLPPEAPVAPRALRNTIAATLIALTLAVIAVLAFDASRRRPLDPAS
jgi:uncharacterized protein involved in exopolysaccharide biosynthesis